MSKDWRPKVYKKHEQDHGLTDDEWQFLRTIVIRRDKFVCQRCDERMRMSFLSVHHIKPRSEGGSNDITNLVTLCNDCHDIVEIKGYKTLAEIIGSFDAVESRESNNYNDIDFSDWHVWVYGGVRTRKPIKAKARGVA